MSTALDYKQVLNRILNEKGGISDTAATEKRSDSLSRLRTYVNEMLAIRNGDVSYNKLTCPSNAGNTCDQHFYRNYGEIQTAINGSPNYLSIKDLNSALDRITYCTCDGRTAPGCICNGNLLPDACLCNGRSSLRACDCEGRYGGKYGPPPCNCNTRVGSLCDCLARSATPSCTCHGRCSCNEQKLFSPIKKTDCYCNTRVVPSCSCNTRQFYACTEHACDCYARSNGYWYKYGDIPYWTQCAGNVNEQYTNVNICDCVSRCSCNAKKIATIEEYSNELMFKMPMKVDTTIAAQSWSYFTISIKRGETEVIPKITKEMNEKLLADGLGYDGYFFVNNGYVPNYSEYIYNKHLWDLYLTKNRCGYIEENKDAPNGFKIMFPNSVPNDMTITYVFISNKNISSIINGTGIRTSINNKTTILLQDDTIDDISGTKEYYARLSPENQIYRTPITEKKLIYDEHTGWWNQETVTMSYRFTLNVNSNPIIDLRSTPFYTSEMQGGYWSRRTPASGIEYYYIYGYSYKYNYYPKYYEVRYYGPTGTEYPNGVYVPNWLDLYQNDEFSFAFWSDYMNRYQCGWYEVHSYTGVYDSLLFHNKDGGNRVYEVHKTAAFTQSIG